MIPPEIESFLKYDYAETKDLAKSFLTVVSALLVFSVAFSDKIIDFAHAKPTPRILLIVAWSLFILSMVAGGGGLYFISISGAQALYSGWGAPPHTLLVSPEATYRDTELTAFYCLMVAGFVFVAGLFALMLSAVMSLKTRGQDPTAAK
jgi:hypothetical protein